MDRNLAAEINALQEYVLVVSSDSDAEDLLCERYLEKEETLYLAAFYRAIRPPFNLDNITAPKATQLFQFAKDDLETLCRLLRLPPVMSGRNRTSWSGMEGLCLVLRRLSYPCRLVDMEEVFGRGTSEASVIINDTIDFLYNEWGRLLTDLDQHTDYWLTPEKVEELCTSIHNAGCPLENVWAFIDGTCRPICRPRHHQRLWYSGHKRRHVMKFQSLMAPCGIVVHLFGPFEGRRHDSAMFEASGLLAQLQHHMNRPDGRPYTAYGDKGFPIREHLLGPYKGRDLTALEQHFNSVMSSVRISVEWGYSGVTQQFAFLQHKENLKIGLQPVAQFYVVATVLANCFSCLYGNQVSTYFESRPPSLDEYLHFP